ncbi:MAG TPA: CinA family protein [Hyphomicrobiaceae bacterium]|nr:CinA family protein [Hyphomicrobiaceae bacterium]
MFSEELVRQAERLLDRLRGKSLTLATAESCTGGLLAGLLTEIAGASDVLERGWVTYSNEAKVEELGVEPALIAAHGAVSAEVAQAMAVGALDRSSADVAVAITGIAGPSGGTAEKPVGLVHLAALRRGRSPRHRELRLGNIGRRQVRHQSIEAALALIEVVL